MTAGNPVSQIVALGGGHGLYASLQALKQLDVGITAVVTVADNGGSSGRLRSEMDIIPPGDLRMALAALCDETDPGSVYWRDLLQYRFSTDGPLNAHSLGNLILTAIWAREGSEVAGLARLGELIGARGSVLPMATTPLTIHADVSGILQGDENETFRVTGQVQVAKTSGKVEQVFITPENARATPEVLEAISRADHIVLGPGSWYTSVLPHLLIPEILQAINASRASTTVVMNLGAQVGETAGMTLGDHFAALRKHVAEFTPGTLVVDPTALANDGSLTEQVEELGIRLVVRDVARTKERTIHDPLKLARTYGDLFGLDRLAESPR